MSSAFLKILGLRPDRITTWSSSFALILQALNEVYAKFSTKKKPYVIF